MKSVLPAALLSSVIGTAIPASAQGLIEHHAAGYVLIGYQAEVSCPAWGCRSDLRNAWGGGWESRRTADGLSMAVEGLQRYDRFLVSPDLSYHFAVRGQRLFDPFAAAGLTLALGAGDAGIGVGQSGFNFGGGLNLWPTRRFGLRSEFRDYSPSVQYSGEHRQEFRIGLTFR
jgi:hypothetical protein